MTEKNTNILIRATINLCMMNKQIDLLEKCNVHLEDIEYFKKKREIANDDLLDILQKINN
jgi:nicotinic acid phosphoribosyltransferase